MSDTDVEQSQSVGAGKKEADRQDHGLLKYPDCQLQNTVKLAEAENV